MLLDLLTLSGVQVIGTTLTSDGMGGETIATTSSILMSAAIYQNNSRNNVFSDRVNASSTDILITDPSFHSWSKDDTQVINGSKVYNITGIPDDVMELGEIMVVGLERII